MRWASLLIRRPSGLKMFFSLRSSISSRSTSGSTTTPSPMTQVFPGWSIPEGMRWKMNFSSPTMTVWPALLPPWKRTTTSAWSASMSTIFPLPSSPHWAPTMTTLLAIFPQPLRLHYVLHVKGKTRGRAPVAVPLNEGVIPAAAQYGFPEAGREALEYDPGIIIKAPDLAEVYCHVVPETPLGYYIANAP